MIEKIKSPADIKKLSFKELNDLAKSVRERIIEVTAKNGGHIAPSLGVTDLTIALLKVFDPLHERIVWDVGHQSYAFKILTERNEKFDTLRKFEGLSGFNKLSESKYDAFGVGHSSTSISAAIGISEAKKSMNIEEKTIAIIGDGALTGGMAFEALNHAGHLQNQNLIVILNDNEMSISKNVGALQNYLTTVLTSKSYNKIKEQVWALSNSLPKNFRQKFITGAQKLEESFINIFVPNIIFEDLGFKYIGPIDGHDIPRLTRIFTKIKKNIFGPVFVHVITQKGKGYEFAEQNSTKFHGLGPFQQETGETTPSKSVSWSKIFGNKLCKMTKDDPKIIAVTAAMSEGTGLSKFEEQFPNNFFDVGIAEQHAITFAGGLSTIGLKPFVAIYSTFMQRAYDQFLHDIALQNLNIVLCLDRAGIVGEDGPTHHGVFDIAYLSHIPNLTIMSPSCAQELEMMLDFSYQNNGPIVIRYPRGVACDARRKLTKLEKGKIEEVQEGHEIAIIAVGNKLHEAQLVSKILTKKNKIITIANLRFIKPLDEKYLKSLLQKHKFVITIEDGIKKGGVASLINSYYCNTEMKVLNFGISDEFVPHGETNKLLEFLQLTPENIAEDILKFLKNNNS